MLRIAIIRLSAMGDIIHSVSILPHLLEGLVKQHKQIHISWYVDSAFSDILEDSPNINTLIKIPLKQCIKDKNIKELYKIYKELKSHKYDVVLDFQGLIKSALIGKILQSKEFVGFNKNSIKEPIASIFYTKKIDIPYEKHILLRNATLAFRAFNLTPPSLEVLLKTKPFLGFKEHNFNINEDTKILLALETSKKNKTYNLESYLKLVQLFNQINIKPILLSYETKIDSSDNYYNIHAPKLESIKSLISQMNLVIGGDTGIVHLAWALNIPSITLFGATPSSRFSLTTPKNLHIQANKNANYDKNDFSINDILPREIFDLSLKILNERQQ
ncbi:MULTISPECIES: lipopolysaccharide heptosyltransferase I [Helicobacter]|uniref:Lipopolysaccharide heptosyltransferase 1 n=1 Tax=Helicobacter ibis TaxID=2962633 RepID=A0ABT4VCN4_9HELI|nr:MULTISPECIES: lipopolysaccharide heptosyltransferase I [Helicobacter]MDA3966754.1 lipopolysaccharide heptosyltransferase I [Helicobacter sp. WB40]MDA3968464.1 lipopolysaccharide heptosyltransferase I [Helicobacter ibis]